MASRAEQTVKGEFARAEETVALTCRLVNGKL